MSKLVIIASGYCDKAIEAGRTLVEIMSHLESVFDGGDEAVLVQKSDHQEIWLVYDDSRPSELIFKLEKDYK